MIRILKVDNIRRAIEFGAMEAQERKKEEEKLGLPFLYFCGINSWDVSSLLTVLLHLTILPLYVWRKLFKNKSNSFYNLSRLY